MSFARLPLVAGFIDRVYLFTALAGSGAPVLLAMATAGSAIGFLHDFRFLGVIFVPREEGETRAGAAEPAVLAVSGGRLLLGGPWPHPFMALARGALA